ncbi:MAG: alpha/beta fold hydrolase BchO [Sedimentitalea sp.]
MRWPDDAADWPLRDFSRIIAHRPHRWHVQEAGRGDTLLLLHGAGGGSQSWRALFPVLAQTHHVIALDLPGQGFSQLGARHRCGLDAMAVDMVSLIDAQNWQVSAIIGHSAGGALALRLAEMIPVEAVIGINPALSNFKGVASWLFPMMAKMLAVTPFTADLFSTMMRKPASVNRLIAGTGSILANEELVWYQRLVSDRAHVDATLAMMAQWSLDGLVSRLGQMDTRTLFLTGDKDRAVPPTVSDQSARLMANATVQHLTDLGHLAHEEDPERIAKLILDFLDGSTTGQT